MRETNIEFVKRVMSFSPTGAMSQMFILEAIRRYSTEITHKQDEVRLKMKDSVISPESWINTAEFLQKELEARNA